MRKKSIALAVVLALTVAAPASWAAGCSGSADNTATRTTAATATDTVSSADLLSSTSAAIQEQLSRSPGVHFVMDSTTTAGGQTVSASGEGDMIFPDSLAMTTQNYTGPAPTAVDVIVTGGKLYTRLSGGAWKTSPLASAGLPDPSSLVTDMDYASSSRLIGQESLRGGRRTWHVQATIDAGIAADEAARHTSDPALLQQIQSTRTAAITVDFWAGTDDHLIYQENVKTANAATGLSSQVNFVFSDWGKTVAISPPCNNC